MASQVKHHTHKIATFISKKEKVKVFFLKENEMFGKDTHRYTTKTSK